MKLPDLQDALQKIGLDAAVFVSRDSDPQISYFTGYNGIGHLVVPSKKDPFLMVPKMEEVKSRKVGIDVELAPPNAIDGIRELFEKRGILRSRIGVDAPRVSMAASQALVSISSDLVDVSDVLASLRQVKVASEVELFREGCGVTDRIFEAAWKAWSDFKTESDVAAFLGFEAAKRGCRTSFPTIVASGSHAGMPHHETADHPLMAGFCVIDFGIVYKGYCTDMSRTVCIGGPSKAMRDAYDAVARAQAAAIDAVRPGVVCMELDRIARKSLGARKKLFVHGLGHGIGVEIHEAPWINARSTSILEPGMVITIEPGVYSDVLGVRIEDDLLVTKDGCELLTKADRDLLTF